MRELIEGLHFFDTGLKTILLELVKQYEAGWKKEFFKAVEGLLPSYPNERGAFQDILQAGLLEQAQEKTETSFVPGAVIMTRDFFNKPGEVNETKCASCPDDEEIGAFLNEMKGVELDTEGVSANLSTRDFHTKAPEIANLDASKGKNEQVESGGEEEEAELPKELFEEEKEERVLNFSEAVTLESYKSFYGVDVEGVDQSMAMELLKDRAQVVGFTQVSKYKYARTLAEALFKFEEKEEKERLNGDQGDEIIVGK